jgi:hypothetical protein
MARVIQSSVYKSQKKKRPGVHAKTKHSVSKNSKNYVKAYKGQGRSK